MFSDVIDKESVKRTTHNSNKLNLLNSIRAFDRYLLELISDGSRDYFQGKESEEEVREDILQQYLNETNDGKGLKTVVQVMRDAAFDVGVQRLGTRLIHDLLLNLQDAQYEHEESLLRGGGRQVIDSDTSRVRRLTIVLKRKPVQVSVAGTTNRVTLSANMGFIESRETKDPYNTVKKDRLPPPAGSRSNEIVRAEEWVLSMIDMSVLSATISALQCVDDSIVQLICLRTIRMFIDANVSI